MESTGDQQDASMCQTIAISCNWRMAMASSAVFTTGGVLALQKQEFQADVLPGSGAGLPPADRTGAGATSEL